MNTENMELRAIGFIHNSLDVKEPFNQQGMPGYYYEKIDYLKRAIEILETQIHTYTTNAKGWERGLGLSMNNLMNTSLEGGKKKKKARKTKKSKRV
jgi:hypothetical protein